MVKGLDIFRNHFRDYNESYILIGGAASELLMAEAGETFRTTRDLDIVLCVEALSIEFVNAFWEFIKLGAYNNRQVSTGDKQYYRFSKPDKSDYPVMIELFSRRPDILGVSPDSRITPIPFGDDASSLSAILMDDVYYSFIRRGRIDLDGISLIGPEYLIPMKIHAWLDMNERKKNGEQVDSNDIKKHRNDVFRLYRIVTPGKPLTVPSVIKQDIDLFARYVLNDSIDMKSLGYRNLVLSDILDEINSYYKAE